MTVGEPCGVLEDRIWWPGIGHGLRQTNCSEDSKTTCHPRCCRNIAVTASGTLGRITPGKRTLLDAKT